MDAGSKRQNKMVRNGKRKHSEQARKVLRFLARRREHQRVTAFCRYHRVLEIENEIRRRAFDDYMVSFAAVHMDGHDELKPEM